MADQWFIGALVVDGLGGEPQLRDVQVVDGRIAEIGSAPGGATGADLQGCTLTPGLIDAHVHLGVASPIDALISHRLSAAEIAADIFANATQTLAQGFTSVRDCGGIDGGVARTIATGKVAGPRVLQCGPIQCQTGGHGHYAADWEPTGLWCSHEIPGLFAFALLADGPDEVRKNVRETFRRGADFIKMCVSGGVISSHDDIEDTQFTVDEIAAAVQEATARGTYVTVHSHNNAGIRNAVEGGVRCIEHASALDEPTAALMAERGVAHVPTLLTIDRIARDAAAGGLPDSISDRARVVQQGQRDGVLVSRAAGLKVGLGTDLLGPDQSGRGEELALRAAMESPMDALVAATRVNAEILGLADRIGTIETGKVADLVAWRDNPIEDATAFADPKNSVLVVQAGRVVKDLR